MYLNGYSGIFIFIFFYGAHFVRFGLLFLFSIKIFCQIGSTKSNSQLFKFFLFKLNFRAKNLDFNPKLNFQNHQKVK